MTKMVPDTFDIEIAVRTSIDAMIEFGLTSENEPGDPTGWPADKQNCLDWLLARTEKQSNHDLIVVSLPRFAALTHLRNGTFDVYYSKALDAEDRADMSQDAAIAWLQPWLNPPASIQRIVNILINRHVELLIVTA